MGQRSDAVNPVSALCAKHIKADRGLKAINMTYIIDGKRNRGTANEIGTLVIGGEETSSQSFIPANSRRRSKHVH